jgi:hypothetical protein
VAWSTFQGLSWTSSPQAFAGKVYPGGVVNETVENRVGVGWIADDVMPFVHGDLTGDYYRATAVSLFEDFEKVMAGARVEGLQRPIVEDQNVDPSKGAKKTRMSSVAARERKIGEQFWDALVEDRAIIPASLVAESGSQPTLSDPGWAADGQVVVRIDPLTLDELLEQGAIKTARAAVIDVFDRSLLAQPGVAQARAKPFVVSPGLFAIKEKAEPLGMAQVSCLVGGVDLDESLGHAVETENMQVIERRMRKQDCFS